VVKVVNNTDETGQRPSVAMMAL